MHPKIATAEPRILLTKPANGLDNNGFNNLDFVLGLFRLGAKWASVKTNWFGLGSSTQQFGANWVPI